MSARSLLVFVLWYTAGEVLRAQTDFQFFEPVQPARRVQVMVHRGMAMAAPENSRSAIETCAQDYCEWAEIDVRLRKDGHHVVIHDETVETATNGIRAVADLAWDELRQVESGAAFANRFSGERLLLLSEALDAAKGRINLYLDCKQFDPDLLSQEIITAGLQRQVIVYASPDELRKLRLASQGSIAGMTKFSPEIDLASFVKGLSPAAVEIDASDVTAELCQRFHSAGIKVQVKVLGEKWDRPEVWGRVIDAGVDWLQTEDPVGLRFLEVRRRIERFPVMIALHRGASRYAPESTLPAIGQAARLGVDFAEIDIRTTLDGRTVLMHDAAVNRTTGGKGAVRELRYEQITDLDAGRWFGKPFRGTRVPSFEDGLNALGPRMSVYLDAKDISPELLIRAVRDHGLIERHVVYQIASLL